MRYKSTNEATCIGFAAKIVVSHFVFEKALHAQQRAGVEISNRELRELGHRVASSAKNVKFPTNVHVLTFRRAARIPLKRGGRSFCGNETAPIRPLAG